MAGRTKKVLITSTKGLLGSTLLFALKKRNKEFTVYDLPVDIGDREAVLSYYSPSKKFDWVIHTAALTNVANCEENRRKCYATNFLGTKNVRDLAKAQGAFLINISTVSVFYGEHGNYTEEDLPYPKNFYNICKLLGEQAIAEYEKGITLRVNLIGIHPEGSRGKNFLEWLIDAITENRDITLFTDVLINPLSNWTLAEHILKLIEMEPTEKILHVGSTNTLSKADIGSLVLKHFPDYTGNITHSSIDSIGDNVSRPKQMWLNTDYVQKKLKIKMPTLESEIKKILNYYNE